MTGIAAARRWVALVVLGLAASLLAVVGPTAGPASAEGEVTVTWPTMTRFNPTLTPYVVETAYDGPGELRLWRSGYGGSVLLPSTGQHEAVFPRNGAFQLGVMLCNPSCTTVSTSPYLYQFKSLDVFLGDDWWPDEPRFGPHSLVDVQVRPEDEDAALTWEIVPEGSPTDPALASGTHQVTAPTYAPIDLGAPDLVDGARYLLRGTGSADTADFGHLEGTFAVPFTWDAAPPVDTTIDIGHQERIDGKTQWVQDRVFYPRYDRYRDRLFIHLQSGYADRPYGASMTITDADGNLVRERELRPGSFDTQHTWDWNGNDETGAHVAEGLYTIVVRAWDRAGNARQVTRSMRVSYAVKKTVVWRKTFTAADTVLDKTVGRCGTLKRPARATWEGSLGYLSRSGCRRAEDSVVATTNGVHIKHSPVEEYKGIRITVNGGKSAGETDSYLVLYYLDRHDDWVARSQLSGTVGKHPGRWYDGPRAILPDAQDDRPYVIWSAGLAGGAKYDVKSFTVEVKMVILR